VGEGLFLKDGVEGLLVVVGEEDVVGAQLGDLLGYAPVKGDGAAGRLLLAQAAAVVCRLV
jgi:hypothetical protein